MEKYTEKISAAIFSVICIFAILFIVPPKNAQAALINSSFGDVNNDGLTDMSDVTLLQNYLVKKYPTAINLIVADIDGSGSVNVFDLIYLKRYLVYGTYPVITEPITTAVSKVSLTQPTVTAEPVEKVYAKEVLRLVNEEREKAGVEPLILNEKLCSIASLRAEEITSLFSHTRPDGREFYTALSDSGTNYSYVGENIAAGQRTPEQVMNSWIKSQGHYENIISSDYEELGLGYVYDPDSAYKYYWVQIFREY